VISEGTQRRQISSRRRGRHGGRRTWSRGPSRHTARDDTGGNLHSTDHI